MWGKPIGTHQGISHALAKAKIAVDLAALVTAKAAWLHDPRSTTGCEVGPVGRLAPAD